MIFGWQEKFTEEMILKGIDVMHDITEMDRTINTLSATVNENGEEYWVNIELNDDFTVESMKCSCKKRRCHHMTAVLQADMEDFKKDMDCREFLDVVDKKKLKNFIEMQLITNWECQMDFIEKFRHDMINNDKIQIEDKLYLILLYPKYDDLLTDFVKNDLTRIYGEDPVVAFYLITSMFYTVITDISYKKNSKLWSCWYMIEDLIIKLSKKEPGLVEGFIYECREEGYGIEYREFRKMMSKLNLKHES